MPDAPVRASATGLTAQFQTLARALGAAAGIMEDDLEDLAERGMSHGSATLWLESRYITVTMLSVALTEAVANAILAMALPPSAILKAQKKGLLYKWKTGIPDAIGCSPFLSGPMENALQALLKARHSVVHAKPRVYAGDRVIHDGDADEWLALEPDNVRRFVELPLLLLSQVPRTANFSFPIQVGAEDYWLHQAIARGKGTMGRSPSAWRPTTKEARAKTTMPP